MSEDEADYLVSERRMREGDISLDQYLKKHGQGLRKSIKPM